MEPEKKDIRNYYSCKRRTDYVTGFAIVFFVMVILFELYVVLWMPIHLQRQELLEEHTSREVMLRNFDQLRWKCFTLAKKNGGFARGEIEQTLRVLNLYAIYLRKNAALMDLRKIHEFQKTLGRFEAFAAAWEKKKFFYHKEQFDLAPAVGALEKKNRL